MGTRRGASLMLLLVGCSMALLAGLSGADVVEHTFHVGNLTLSRLCEERTVVAVNGQVPGPTIEAREGDTVVVHVLNHSPYNLSVHWHGIFQLLSGWADGPSYVTQCPILPGNRYTYRFNITGQEGTLWWHAHFSYLRANVYGALIIRPRDHPAASYPFGVKPYAEVPIILGEWWEANVVQVEDEALRGGGLPNVSDAFTINGLPGRLYPCGSDETTYTLSLERGETYLLRVINAAVNNQLFFKIAGHRLTVVAVDASYTEPYTTDVLVLAPGHTVDALLVADADPRQRYHMAARPYFTLPLPFDNTITVGIVQYNNQSCASSPVVMPALPAFNDTPTAHRFYTSLVSSAASAASNPVPLRVDHKMFITYGVSFVPCDEASGPNCNPPFGRKFAATMNNISFAFPTKMSMLEASFRGQTDGVFTRDFPDRPPLRFNYTDPNLIPDVNNPITATVKATRTKRLKYNATVEVVLQNVAFLGTENHPIHLHGFNFFVLAQGFGNYNAREARRQLNLVNPLVRNTIPVPNGGWAVIRFVANNPGVWIMHCHLDVHLPIGLGMAFEVENGPTPSTTLPPPPEDFPRC